MKTLNYLALDLSAESGRAIVGSLADGKLTLSRIHRFPNGPLHTDDGLHWNLSRLWASIKQGIRKSKTIDSIGLTTWGVDFVLLDKDRSLLGNPFHYRDARTDGMMEEAFKSMPRAEIFANSGVQFMKLNTLYQLLATTKAHPEIFDIAKTFLTMPDLFNFWLTGEVTNEFTIATTTQLFDACKRDWSTKILEAFEIPTHLFQPITEPGTQIGTLLPALAEETGVGTIPVMLPACHDTGSAVVAVPAMNEDFVWLSSSTWSVMGTEVLEPCLTERAFVYNFTNEGGVSGTWRLSKNIMGVWLAYECRREWMRQGEKISFNTLIQLAGNAEPFMAVIDPDDPLFLLPGDLPSCIQRFCVETNQRVPKTKGEIIRVILESIALKYRLVLEHMEELTGKHLGPLYIVGNGARNRLLNQFAANSTRRTVIAGPVEAIAVGNILMQAVGMKDLGSLAEAREVVRVSFEPEIYEPKRTADWHEAYARLQKVMQ